MLNLTNYVKLLPQEETFEQKPTFEKQLLT